jgi:hypothetical protein
MLTRLGLCVGLFVSIGIARADEPAATPTPAPAAIAPAPALAPAAADSTSASASTTVEPAAPTPDNPDAKGKFNAGGALAFPSGPDDTGKYASFNWVKLNAIGRYNPSDLTRVYINIPVAVKKADLPGESPSMFGGVTARGELGAKVAGVQVTVGMMKEGAFFYSDKMFPLYVGDYEPAVSIGPYINIKHWGLYFMTAPAIAYQKSGGLKLNGTNDGGAAVQLPLSAAVHLGSLLEVAADTGLYTGNGFSFDAKQNASIFAGGSLTVKVKPVMVHLGAGVASLLTDQMAAYHSIGDSVYFDLNVKYVK